MKISISILVIIAFFVGVSCRSSTSPNNGKIHIKNPWVKGVSASQKMSVGYMTLENPNSKNDKLLSIQSDVCEVVEIHNMTHENDMMKMRRVNEIEVPANGSVELKRGGLHLMLIHLKKPLKPGDRIKLILSFQNAGKQGVTVPVKKMEGIKHP